MITVLTGSNSFEVERALQQKMTEFSGTTERVDGSDVELTQLPELLTGATLFTAERLVIIKNLSQSRDAWQALPDWLERTNSNVILVEPSLDKRTVIYKNLQKHATIQEFPEWTERDSMKAAQWTVQEAEQIGFSLDKTYAETIVRRSLKPSDRPGQNVIDQWQIYHALEKLAVLDSISPKVIDDVIDASPIENVFELFEAALQGKITRVQEMTRYFSQHEEPLKVWGLLTGQVFQLTALFYAEKPTTDVAKDIGAHPFVLSKLAPYAKKMTKLQIKAMVTEFAQTDIELKTSSSEPWIVIETTLLKMSEKS